MRFSVQVVGSRWAAQCLRFWVVVESLGLVLLV